MTLAATDFQQIRTIVREEVDSIVQVKSQPIENELKALRNDVKEIYNMITELEDRTITGKRFEKLTLEQKLLTLNAELLAAAKQAGITLPRT